MTQDYHSQDKLSELRTQAEAALPNKRFDVPDISALCTEEIQELFHELHVHQIELEMQNEDLRQAQLKLEELKDRYLDLYDLAPVGYMTLNDRGLILEANLAAVGLLGTERTSLIKMFLSRFVPKEFLNPYYLYLKQVFQSQSKQTCEIKMTKKDGTVFNALLESIPVKDESGHSIQCRTILTDITERKQAEQRIQGVLAYAENIVNTVREPLVVLDGDMHVVSANHSFYSMFRVTPEETKGNQLYDLGNRQWDIPRLHELLEEILPKKTVVTDFEVDHIFPEIGHKILFLNARQIVQQEGDETRKLILLAIEDCTSRRLAESALQEVHTELEHRFEERTSELRESEKKFRYMTENSSDVIWHLDRNYCFDYISPADERIRGFMQHEVIGTTVWSLLKPEGIEHVKHVNAQRLSDEHNGIRTGTVRYELEQICKDGSWIWTEVNVSAHHDQNGELIGLHGVARDITDRKRMEDAIKQSEQRYRGVFNNAAVGIMLVTESGRFMQGNSSLHDMLGYTEEELKMMSIFDITFPEDIQISKEKLDDMKQSDLSDYRLEKRYVRKDGALLWVDLSVSSIRDSEGRHIASIGVISNITERKREEEALKLLYAAIKQAAEGIIITDPAGIIQYVNPAEETITGYNCDELIGRTPSIFKRDEHDEAFYRKIWETINAGNVWSGRFINKKKDGTEYHEDASISPVYDKSGNLTNFVAVRRDVTKEIGLQQQLFQSQQMEAIGTLAGGFAHDFNNLLQVILAHLDVILSIPDLPEKIQSSLNNIDRAATSGAELIKGMMLLSKKMPFKLRPVDINTIVTSFESLIYRTIPKEIKIQILMAHDLPAINGDPTQIEQVLINLAINARDAMPDGGGLTIETRNTLLDEEFCRFYPDLKPGRYLLLSVMDSGKGMDQETVKHIFEPFFTTKEPGKGTGLGLSVVYGIIEKHGGKIICYSDPSVGTTFRIYFPAIEVPE